KEVRRGIGSPGKKIEVLSRTRPARQALAAMERHGGPYMRKRFALLSSQRISDQHPQSQRGRGDVEGVELLDFVMSLEDLLSLRGGKVIGGKRFDERGGSF